MGIRMRLLAAASGISAECVVQVAASTLPVRGVDSSSIHVVEARLSIPEPDDAALLAAVLRLPAVPRRVVTDDWLWRGWLAGDAAHDTLLSVTLSGESGAESRQSRAPGDV
ncbi:hypothetical protein [Promicromonospora sukumoe]|uniref:hypothetical protein n=1 Tax=Promicromonospora sukumoe TaxID=88382 RepID=UPI0031DA3C91